MRPFDAPVAPPATFPSPFGAPHPIAQAAAAELQAWLTAHLPPGEGKMFGVLVVADPQGALGQLWAFSGKLGDWERPGFVPPVFDPAAQDAFWPRGVAHLARDAAILSAARQARDDAQAAIDAQRAAHLEARVEVKARHRRRRDARAAARRAGADEAELAQASRADKAEWRTLKADERARMVPLEARLAEAEQARRRAAKTRADLSRALHAQLHDTYRFRNARGDEIALVDLFAPHPPTAGAGDCAAPKLLAEAYRRGLTPIALAEFWWGPPPAAGGRWHTHAYPACRGRCGVILPFMLQGLAVEPAPAFEDPRAGVPAVLHEDDALLVVDKPAGLLSVPGRRRQRTVLSMLGRDDVRPAHRLDLDTSGVLVLAKTQPICIAMQRQFASRAVAKRYIAVLAHDLPGALGADGRIDLALKPDFADRPRQMHHPKGKAAITRWTRLAADRVALCPETGRTHQLRVHCAHLLGLGVPIRGDRLYGTSASRLHLHAESITFAHPLTNAPITVRSPAPF